LQAWLNDRPIWEIPDTIVADKPNGRAMMVPNPEFQQWMVVNRQTMTLHQYLLKTKGAGHYVDNGGFSSPTVQIEDFPASLRGAAQQAAHLNDADEIDRLMPLGIRLGKKA
jgi:hypothetical protein